MFWFFHTFGNVVKIPWRRKWQPTPVFLPGESHGQRSLVGYCPQGHKESDTTEQLHTHKTLEDVMGIQKEMVGEVSAWALHFRLENSAHPGK